MPYRVENIVRKEEIACYKHILLFSQCFLQLNIFKNKMPYKVENIVRKGIFSQCFLQLYILWHCVEWVNHRFMTSVLSNNRRYHGVDWFFGVQKKMPKVKCFPRSAHVQWIMAVKIILPEHRNSLRMSSI